MREQVEFNRKMWRASTARSRRSPTPIARISELRRPHRGRAATELKDIRNHWADWRAEWERKLQQNEIQFLRSVADLQGAFQHRVTVMDAELPRVDAAAAHGVHRASST